MSVTKKSSAKVCLTVGEYGVIDLHSAFKSEAETDSWRMPHQSMPPAAPVVQIMVVFID